VWAFTNAKRCTLPRQASDGLHAFLKKILPLFFIAAAFKAVYSVTYTLSYVAIGT
jgi:hypothetical protein